MNSIAIDRRWQTSLGLLAMLFVWIIICYYGTAEAMVGIWWRSETFNHAFLVPPISLWLVWRKRHELACLKPQPDPRFLMPLALTGLVWLLGELAAINVVTQFAMVIMLLLCVPILLGWPLTRAIVFPLGFLLFAVPFGEFVMPMMMVYTANFTVLALKLTGIPVFQEGQHFVIPTGSWSVIEACSGVRYLIASIVLGTLYAYLNYASLKKRLVFIGVSILVPIVANWARAYIIVMLGYLSGNRLAVGVDHIIYGWLFFGLVIMIMFSIGMRWADTSPVSTTMPPPPSGGARAPSKNLVWVAILAVLIIAFPVFWITHAESLANEKASDQIAELQPVEWSSISGVGTTWTPEYANPSLVWRHEYQRGNQRIGVYLGYYRDQNFERKLVSSENVLVRSKDPEWIQVSQNQKAVEIDGHDVVAHTAELRNNNGQRLQVWYWYWVNGKLISSPALAKIDIALDKLLGRGDDSAVVMTYAYEDIDKNDATLAIKSFLQSNGSQIGKALQQTRQQGKD